MIFYALYTNAADAHPASVLVVQELWSCTSIKMAFDFVNPNWQKNLLAIVGDEKEIVDEIATILAHSKGLRQVWHISHLGNVVETRDV